MEEQGLIPWENVHVSNVIRWFSMNPKFYPDLSFKIFVDSGKFLFERKAIIDVRNARVVYLHYATQSKMWRYIFNIQAFFNLRQTNQRYCTTCNLFHDVRARGGQCPWENFKIAATPGPGKLSYRPTWDHKAIVFADTEAMLPKKGKVRQHILSHVGALATFDEKVIDYNHWQTYNEDDNPEELVDKMFEKLIENYELLDQGVRIIESEDYETCPICPRRSKHFYTGYSMATGETVTNVCEWCWKLIHGVIIIFMHNLSSYDNLLMLSAIINSEKLMVKNDQIIAKAVNRWEAFFVSIENSYYKFLFKDSFKLIPGSLANHVSEFWKAKEVPILGYPEARLKKKGAFPYEYFDSHNKLYLPLPLDKESWWNELTQTYIEMEEAIKDFTEEGFSNLGEYMLFYLENDCVLLAEVFYAARRGIRQVLPYDLSYFHSLPSLSLYCAKQSVGENIGNNFAILPVELQKYFFSNVRGGITQATIPHVDLDGYFDSGSIEYVDFASLYPSAMSMALSIAGTIKELTGEAFDFFKAHLMGNAYQGLLRQLKKFEYTNDGTGYFAEVEWHYPKELHDRDWQLPLLEKRNPISGGLINDFLPTKQLMTDRRIMFLIYAGLKLVNVTRIFTFEQSKFLTPYIRELYEQRIRLIDNGQKIAATNCKLLLNSLYGKTVEDPRKYKEIKIVEIGVYTLQRSERFALLGDNYAIISQGAATDLYSVPSLGFHILENSKSIFYEAWHEMNCFFNLKPIIDLPDMADWAIDRGLNYTEHLMQLADNMNEYFKAKTVSLAKQVAEYIPAATVLQSFDFTNQVEEATNQIKAKGTQVHVMIENLAWYTSDYTLRLLYCDTDSFIIHAPHFGPSKFWDADVIPENWQDSEIVDYMRDKTSFESLWDYLCAKFPHLFNVEGKQLGKLDREQEGIREVIALGSKNYYVRAVEEKDVVIDEAVDKKLEKVYDWAQSISNMLDWILPHAPNETLTKANTVLNTILEKRTVKNTVEIKKLKGVTLYKDKAGMAIITRQTYLNALLKHQTLIVKQYRIQRKEFTLYGIEQNKIAMSGMNNKRIVINEHLTLPYGYDGEKFRSVMYT